MRRRLLNFLTGLSLLLCVAVVVLWVRSFDYATVPATHVGEVRVYIADRVEVVGTRKYYAYSTLGRVHVGRSTRWTGPFDKPLDLGGAPTPYSAQPTLSVLRDVDRPGFSGAVSAPKRPLFGRWEPLRSLQPTPRWGREEERGVELYFPHGLLAVALVVLPAARLAAIATRRRRAKRNLCPSCGYDLRATPGRCPECGTTKPDHTPHHTT